MHLDKLKDVPLSTGVAISAISVPRFSLNKDLTSSFCKWEKFGVFECWVTTLSGWLESLLVFSAHVRTHVLRLPTEIQS